MLKVSAVDTAVMLGYMLLVTAMGLYFARKNTSTEEYFLGGRRFSGWAIGLSMVGTAISSITFLAMPADAFKTTWIRYVTYGGLPIAAFIATRWVVDIFRGHNITSVYEYLENRFGASIRVYGSITYILAQLMRISVILYLLALLFHEISNIDIVTCILIVGLFVGFYTVIGGIDAVIWTDILQTIVLALGSIIGLFMIIHALPGGFGQIIDVAVTNNKFSFGDMVNGVVQDSSWKFAISEKTASMLLLAGISFFMTEYLSGQHMVQRYCAARSSHEAKKALWINVFVSLPVWTFYMLFGTALFVFFTVFPTDEANAMLAVGGRAEKVVPYYVVNYLPVGLVGLMLSAALAAGMSSLDSSINSISTVSVTDIYKRYFRKEHSDREYLLAAKIIATTSMLIMIGGALAIRNATPQTVQHMAFILSSVFTGGLMGLFVLGLFTTRGDARAVWGGITATILFTMSIVLKPFGLVPDAVNLTVDYYYIGMLGNLIMFMLGYGLARLLPRKSVLGDNLTIWSGDRSS